MKPVNQVNIHNMELYICKKKTSNVVFSDYYNKVVY